LDIKPENLMLGNKFQLKIIDFDLSMVNKETTVRGKGTTNFRAPELASE